MAPIPIHLRLEANDGGVEEYRVYDEQIQVRRSNIGNEQDEVSWQRVTPEELTAHVNRKTVVSEWLQRRLGWRRVLRACVTEQDRFLFETGNHNADQRAA